MINLARFREYWQNIAEKFDSITGILPVTIDKEMGKKILALPADSVTIFVFPPLADSNARNPDSFREANKCVVFLMKKYNPQKQTSFAMLEETQPVVEQVKQKLLDDQCGSCPPFIIDVTTLETAPETELYGTFAGWSIAFEATSYGL